MRNLLALGASGVLAFAGIGWYLGWYRIQTAPTPTGRHISIDLNTPKIKEDIGSGKDKLRDLLDDEKSQQNSPVQIQLPKVELPQIPTFPTGFPRETNQQQPFTPIPPGAPPFFPPR